MDSNEIQELLALADRYDAIGLYLYADKVFDKLIPYIDQLPQEAQLRVKSHGNMSQSMGSVEGGQGEMTLKGGLYEYESGKGQQCYKDTLPMDVKFAKKGV